MTSVTSRMRSVTAAAAGECDHGLVVREDDAVDGSEGGEAGVLGGARPVGELARRSFPAPCSAVRFRAPWRSFRRPTVECVPDPEPTEVVAWANELLETRRVARLGLLDRRGCAAGAAGDLRGGRGTDLERDRSEAETGRGAGAAAVPAAGPAGGADGGSLLGRLGPAGLGAGAGRGVGSSRSARAPAGLEALSAKYEQYREEAPPGPLLALEPERYLWWRAADPEGRGGRSGGRGG